MPRLLPSSEPSFLTSIRLTVRLFRNGKIISLGIQEPPLTGGTAATDLDAAYFRYILNMPRDRTERYAFQTSHCQVVGWLLYATASTSRQVLIVVKIVK